MSTYLEIVIQERSTDGRSILTHRHIKIETSRAGDLAQTIVNRINNALKLYATTITHSDPLRPCSLCWQIGQEAQHDPR